MEKSHVNTKNLLKFLFGSAFGILMFLVPIPQGESFTTLLDFLKSGIKGLFGGSLSYIIVGKVIQGVCKLQNRRKEQNYGKLCREMEKRAEREGAERSR